MVSTNFIIVLLAACIYISNAQLYDIQEQPDYIPKSALRGYDNTIHGWEQYQDSFPEHYRVRRQVFGGVNRLPGGGRTQSFGVQAGPAWGSLSQSFNQHGIGTPITYSGGLGHTSPAGHGISGSASIIPGIGGQGNVRGQVGILNTPSHQVTAWGQHDRTLNKDFKPIGPATNSLGVNYANKNNGAGVFGSTSHTSGFPTTGTIGGNIPLINRPNTRLDVTGQSTFGHGMKPDNQVGVQLTHNF